MNPAIRAQTIAQWNDLGFWYDITPETGWINRGSIAGLEKFADLLLHYATDPKNALVSEHDHFGPYMYLKFVTWTEPEINRDGIYGTLPDFVRLSDLVRKHLASCSAGQSFSLAQAFSPASTIELTLHCESASFQPGAYDPQLHE